MTTRILAGIIVLALLFPMVAGHTAATAAKSPSPYDCGFLLSMFYNALSSIIHEEPDTTLIKLMHNATVPQSLRKTHTELYDLLYDIAMVEEKVQKYSHEDKPLPPQEYPALLAKLYQAINSLSDLVENYVDALTGCTRDRTLATIMGIQTSLLYPKLMPLLYRLEQEVLSLAYRGTGSASIEAVEQVVNASNPVIKLCTNSTRARLLEALVFLGHNPAAASSETIPLSWGESGLRCGLLSLDLSGVRPPQLFIFSRGEKVPVWIIAKPLSGNGDVVAPPRLLKVYLFYQSPIEKISIPSNVSYGDNITIRITVRVPVNVTVRIEGITVTKTVVGEGSIIIPTKSLEIGYHTLHLVITPLAYTRLYAPIRYSEAIAITAKIPKVDIVFDNPSISPWNTIKMKIINRAGRAVRVKIDFGFSHIDDIVLGNSTYTLYAPLNPLPWIYRVNVTVMGIDKSFTAYYQGRVLLINPLGIILVTLIAVALALYHDKIDLLHLVGSRPPRLPPRRETSRTSEGYFEALRIRIRRSKAAQLYYALLKRLGIPLPSPPQTLREHWREKVKPIDSSGEATKAMLRAEKDLYGKKSSTKTTD